MFTSSFKFTLPSAEVVQYVRLRIAAPEKSPYVALSRIQLRGHHLGNFQEIEETASSSDQLPLPLALELLSHLLKFDKVQQVIAKHDQVIFLSTLLLNLLSKDTYSHIHEVLWCLAKNNVVLSHKLLDEVLVEGQSSHHAALAGKICSINDAEASKRLEKLQSYVFQQLSRYSFTAFSSQLTPFLNSLSHAISQLHGLQIIVKENEMLQLFNAGNWD